MASINKFGAKHPQCFDETFRLECPAWQHDVCSTLSDLYGELGIATVKDSKPENILQPMLLQQGREFRQKFCVPSALKGRV